jgi:hypothetical protein
MDAALATLSRHWTGRRLPKAFYLNEEDWAEFMATGPAERVTGPWGNNPPVMVTDPGFRGVAVRSSKSPKSRLYDETTSGRELPAKEG